MENDIKTETKKRSPKEMGKFLHEKRALAVANGLKLGRKVGIRTPKTLAREAIEREVKNKIMERAMPLVRAAMIPALGQNFVYKIVEEKSDDRISINKKTGEQKITPGKILSRKHVLVTDPEEIALALDQMEEGASHPDDAYYYVTTKEPDHKAIETLWNRAFGKPRESVDVNVTAKFSLKDLGRRVDEIRKEGLPVMPVALEAQYTEATPINYSPENQGTNVSPSA